MTTDQRLIEDYIPIEAISAEARREKSIRKGHISTLHLWWARRPLVAARAAVYGVLVPAPADKKAADEAEQFVTGLCKYPGAPGVIAEARRHILEAHAARLTAEGVEKGLAPAQAQVTTEDIEAGRAPRPRVLDMFAGGGAIPLEALRLGCEAYALDLNPVAHLIELCTLVYPQQFGAADPSAKGSAADGTWAGLAAEVEHWGKWVLERVQAEIGDLYPPIPDPTADKRRQTGGQYPLDMSIPVGEGRRDASGLMTPVAYLWTRTVRCKNPACGATVPLARQTWLAQKEGRYVALQPIARTSSEVDARTSSGLQNSDDRSPQLVEDGSDKRVRYRVVEATTAEGLGFDPAAGSKGGNVACPFCGTVVDSAYVKVEGQAGRIGVQPMAVVCTRRGKQGKVYLAADDPSCATARTSSGLQHPDNRSPQLVEDVTGGFWPDDAAIWQRIRKLEAETANDPMGPLTVPDEPIEANPRSMDVHIYGFQKWSDLFSSRQMLGLLTFTRQIHMAHTEMLRLGYDELHAKVVVTYLAFALDRLADWNSTLCTWAPEKTGGAKIRNTFARQALPMVWDFVESAVFGDATGSFALCLDWVIQGLTEAWTGNLPAKVTRGSATDPLFAPGLFDAIITDPPYYDNVSYSNLADFYFVWLKRTIGHRLPRTPIWIVDPKEKGGHRRALSSRRRPGSFQAILRGNDGAGLWTGWPHTQARRPSDCGLRTQDDPWLVHSG